QGKELKEKSGEEFFIEYRLERDRVRSQEIQMLREVINNPNSSAQVRNEAQQRLIRLTEYMEQEMQLEALLQAKGYTDACVFIQPTVVHVIVRAHELKEEELNRIGELVGRTSGRKMEEVVIIPWP
ncbi:MAG: SpoIIIAH-like family protein, partial [Clostridia bacterium]|nr:SpoIIIAH-like family protein [Clostridia bacterium]